MEKEPPDKVVQFNTLPKDIIFDIFSRIPLKKLTELTIVCKKWRLNIHQNPEFRGFYHQKHRINPILLFTKQVQINENSSTQFSSCYIDGTQVSQMLTNNFDQPLITNILTSNGILCLLSKTHVFFYDPIIKKLSKIPNSRNFNCTFSWAFGMFRKGFKLLHFYTIETFDNFHYCQMQDVMCEILTKPSFDSQKDWKFIGECPYNDVLGRKNYAYVDGKFYWLIGEKKYNPNGIKIMSFDLGMEIFGMVSFPKKYSDRSVECLELVEINDKLCLTDRLPWESNMDVWMMMKQNEGFPNHWVKKYRIDLMGIDHHDVRILGHLPKIYGNDCESECEGKILMKIGEQKFGFYELKKKVYRDIISDINMKEWSLQLMLNRNTLF
ncbi:unnamed protein product [Amaranthus hypochondriacus]